MSKKVKKNRQEGRRDRVRERYEMVGFDGFLNPEILEYFLYHCIPRHDTKETAHRLLEEFGNVCNVIEAHPQELQKRGKISRNAAIYLNSLSQFFIRYQREKFGKKPKFKDSKELGNYCKVLFLDKKVETFYLICLDKQMRMLSAEMVAAGGLVEVWLNPTRIVDIVRTYGAVGVVLAHNHPSGCLKISDEDITTTAEIRKHLQTLNITVVDHIIVGHDEYVSFVEEKIMPGNNALPGVTGEI